ncbi:uncharacterized protein LOC108678717, partial [Hyalella azteca]|uniref:Nucleolar protein 12 n=1 Tax=Hyalella azteca TaxID=294128 RepID=A0A8B7PBR9_HYAAZ
FFLFRDYVTGFQKRKKERQERAKKFNEARIKKKLLLARAERRKNFNKILAEHEQQTKEINDEFSDESDSDDDVTPKPYESKVGGPAVSNTIITTCGNATVEISTLGLNSDHHLGSNIDFEACKLEGATLARHKNLLKLCTSKTQSKNKDEESQSFSDMVKGVMKKAQKMAKKVEKERAIMKKEDNSMKPIKQRKKKVQVTEL